MIGHENPCCLVVCERQAEMRGGYCAEHIRMRRQAFYEELWGDPACAVWPSGELRKSVFTVGEEMQRFLSSVGGVFNPRDDVADLFSRGTLSNGL